MLPGAPSAPAQLSLSPHTPFASRSPVATRADTTLPTFSTSIPDSYIKLPF